MPYDIGFGEVGEDIIGYAIDGTFAKRGVFYWTERFLSRGGPMIHGPLMIPASAWGRFVMMLTSLIECVPFGSSFLISESWNSPKSSRGKIG
jgi:hypothetical protein